MHPRPHPFPQLLASFTLALAAWAPHSSALADEDSLFTSETLYTSGYFTEGIERFDAPVFGQSLAFNGIIFPLYARVSTALDFGDYHEEEFTLAYSYDLIDYRFQAGFVYSFEQKPRDFLQTRYDNDGRPNGLGLEERTTTIESAEVFVGVLTQELYYTRFLMRYAFDMENLGGLFNAGATIRYDINRYMVWGMGLLVGLDFGYNDIDEVNGLYHADISTSLDFRFFDDSGLKLLLSYTAPIRGSGQHGVYDGMVYQANLHFSLF